MYSLSKQIFSVLENVQISCVFPDRDSSSHFPCFPCAEGNPEYGNLGTDVCESMVTEEYSPHRLGRFLSQFLIKTSQWKPLHVPYNIIIS